MENIKLHTIPILNAVDSIARNSGSKIGVLLGTKEENSVSIWNSFELIIGDSLSVDFDFLQDRLEQFNSVFPNLKIIGIYSIETSGKQDTKTIHILNQLLHYKSLEDESSSNLLLLVVRSAKCLDTDSPLVESYYYNGSLVPVKITATADETEHASIFTVTRKGNFEPNIKDNNSSSITKSQKNNNELLMAIEKLQLKMSDIIRFMDQRSTQNADDTLINISNNLVYLARKIHQFKRYYTADHDNKQLSTSLFALLTQELGALENLKTQISKNIVRYEIRTNASGRFE
ncbi:Piso0_001897 [Millerozyma farinosa CBS 7064]|uniref:Piso0_001897 protein n=1 Tax=Pichia sorbitophila (strain ATCC MYA-4447 / BCRC 22081 / CBS 7064 / NBRC 10061 / NRRL Y-12695) TaxID=559304 RepID=G8YB54_PICSO|nr:Piso0_001897 [Millerozyma farinosa CBS 7064]